MNECVSTSGSNEYVEGSNSNVKLELYKTLGKEVEFKRYFHGISDAGSRLLLSGTHSLNEELGTHKAKNGMIVYFVWRLV